MDRILEDININMVELQTIIDKTSKKSIDTLSKGDRVRLSTINEYLVQALLYAEKLGH